MWKSLTGLELESASLRFVIVLEKVAVVVAHCPTIALCILGNPQPISSKVAN